MCLAVNYAILCKYTLGGSSKNDLLGLRGTLFKNKNSKLIYDRKQNDLKAGSNEAHAQQQENQNSFMLTTSILLRICSKLHRKLYYILSHKIKRNIFRI